MQFPLVDTRYEILLVKIGSRMRSVGLFKKHYVKKTKLLGERQKVTLHSYGEKPSVIRSL